MGKKKEKLIITQTFKESNIDKRKAELEKLMIKIIKASEEI